LYNTVVQDIDCVV